MQSQHRADGQSINSPLCKCDLQVRRGFRGGASRGVDYGPLDLEDLEDAAGKPPEMTSHVQLSHASHHTLQALYIDKTFRADAPSQLQSSVTAW